MRSRRVAGAALAVTALVTAGCSSGRDAPDAPLAFCKAAAEYDYRLSTKAEVPLRVQIRLVQDIVDAAPAKIAPDAETFLDALRRVDDEPSVRDDPRIREAVESVNRFAAQGCDFYARQGGGI